MRDQSEIENKLELKKELLEVIEKDNPNKQFIIGWKEALEWVLATRYNKREERESTDKEKEDKNTGLIDKDSMLGKLLNK